MGKKVKTKGKKGTGVDASPTVPARTSTQAPADQQASSTKRQRNGEEDVAPRSKPGNVNAKHEESGENLVFEDPFGDEFEPEDLEDLEDGDDGEVEEDLKGGTEDEAIKSGNDATGREVMEVDDDRENGEQERHVQTRVWKAGVDELPEGEELEYDSTAYHMYHSLRPEWPCLSFDIIRDKLGTNRSRFPHTIFAVAGTQADRAENNRLQVMKLSELHRTKKASNGSEDEDESEGEDLDETDDDPVLDHVNIPHKGGINRVRSMPQRPHVMATWSETSDVHVWDLEKQVSALEKGGPRTSKVDPAFSFGGHSEVRS